MMSLLLQPHEGRLGELLLEDLRSKQYDTFLFCTAYAKLSGVSALYDDLREFTAAGGTVYAAVGIDQRNTSYEALRAILDLPAELYVVHNRSRASTFHLKVYALIGQTQGKLYVGSNNLTGGGLYTNYEAAMCREFDLTRLPVAQEFVDMINTLKRFLQEGPCSKKATPDLLQTLYDRGMVSTESELRAAGRGADEAGAEREDSLFGLEFFPGSGARPDFSAFTLTPDRDEGAGEAENESGGAEAGGAPAKSFYKRLSGNDVDKKSSPGQIIIPIAFKGFFGPLSEPLETRVGAMQSERYFNLLYENTGELVENARVIFYEPAPEHKRKNSEVRFALRNRGIFDTFRKDNVLVFTQAPKGEERYLCSMKRVSVDSPEIEEYAGRFGWIQE